MAAKPHVKDSVIQLITLDPTHPISSPASRTSLFNPPSDQGSRVASQEAKSGSSSSLEVVSSISGPTLNGPEEMSKQGMLLETLSRVSMNELDTRVVSRPAPQHYGVRAFEPYDPNIHKDGEDRKYSELIPTVSEA
jgi:hypothetical protein